MSEAGEKLIAAIVAAAEEFPDRIVTNCVYFNDSYDDDLNPKDTCPSCIVGEGLARSGLVTDFDAFINITNDKGDRINHNTFDDWYWRFDATKEMTREEVEWVLEAQRNQDKDKTWGFSVREADMHYGKGVGRR